MFGSDVMGFGAVSSHIVQFPGFRVLVPGEFPVALANGSVGGPVPVEVVSLALFAFENRNQSLAIQRDGLFTKIRMLVWVVSFRHVQESGQQVDDVADLIRP